MSSVVHECPDCGLFNMASQPVAGTDIHCSRCDAALRHVRHNSLNNTLACALTALVFYVVTASAPFLQVVLYGRFRFSALTTGAMTLDDQGLWVLASIVLLTTALMPLIKLLGMVYVLIRLRLPRPPRSLAPLFGWLRHISPWVMIEIYLLGFMVAYTRLQAIMYVQMGMGAYALAGLMLAMVAAEAALDPEAVWEEMQRRGVIDNQPHTENFKENLIGCEICHQVSAAEDGDGCPRCGNILYGRKPASMSRSWALMIASAIFYIPSNIFPIMTVVRFGRVQSYTIFGGIQELMKIGLWPLALLVFIASIVIPIFKLLALSYALIQTHRGKTDELQLRTQLYRVIDFIGRWSMVDVFMVSILVALVRFGQLAQIDASVGVVFFASVVVLTMLAVKCFDPRLMWDRMQRQGQEEASAAADRLVSV